MKKKTSFFLLRIFDFTSLHLYSFLDISNCTIIAENVKIILTDINIDSINKYLIREVDF